jgi:hypothetical protein
VGAAAPVLLTVGRFALGAVAALGVEKIFGDDDDGSKKNQVTSTLTGPADDPASGPAAQARREKAADQERKENDQRQLDQLKSNAQHNMEQARAAGQTQIAGIYQQLFDTLSGMKIENDGDLATALDLVSRAGQQAMQAAAAAMGPAQNGANTGAQTADDAAAANSADGDGAEPEDGSDLDGEGAGNGADQNTGIPDLGQAVGPALSGLGALGQAVPAAASLPMDAAQQAASALPGMGAGMAPQAADPLAGEPSAVTDALNDMASDTAPPDDTKNTDDTAPPDDTKNTDDTKNGEHPTGNGKDDKVVDLGEDGKVTATDPKHADVLRDIWKHKDSDPDEATRSAWKRKNVDLTKDPSTWGTRTGPDDAGPGTVIRYGNGKYTSVFTADGKVHAAGGKLEDLSSSSNTDTLEYWKVNS